MDRLATGLEEIGAGLIHPPREAQRHPGIAHCLDPGVGRWRLKREVERGERPQTGLARRGEVGRGVEAEVEGEAPLGVQGIVADLALEHGGVRDADMVAIQRHQHRGARGQPHHPSDIPADLHEVVGAEGLAQAQHDAGDEVLDRVAHPEADRETDDPRRAEDRAEQRRRADHVERDDKGGEQEDDAHDLAVDLADEGVRGDPPPGQACAGHDHAERRDQHEEKQPHQQERDEGGELRQPQPQPLDHRGEAQRNVGRGLDMVRDGDDALDPADQLGQRLGIGLPRDLAVEPDDAGLHPRVDIGIGRYGAEDTLDPRLDGCVVRRRGDGDRAARCDRLARRGKRREETNGDDGGGPSGP